MYFTTLASGSSGNCIYVGSDRSGVLIDCGCSIRAARSAMQTLGIDESRIAAIFVSHEHSDHVKNVAALARALAVPIYASEKTWPALPFCDDFLPWERHIFAYDMQIGDMQVDFFRLAHDAVQPVGFVFQCRGQRVGVVTDSGVITPSMRQKLADVDGLILEANHDAELLRRGSYPAYLKRRIAGELGHLSNAQAAEAVGWLVGEHTRAVLLAHLSAANNEPQLAYETIARALAALELAQPPQLSVAPRNAPHQLICL